MRRLRRFFVPNSAARRRGSTSCWSIAGCLAENECDRRSCCCQPAVWAPSNNLRCRWLPRLRWFTPQHWFTTIFWTKPTPAGTNQRPTRNGATKSVCCWAITCLLIPFTSPASRNRPQLYACWPHPATESVKGKCGRMRGEETSICPRLTTPR